MSIAELPGFSPRLVPSGDEVSDHTQPYPRPGRHRPRASGKFLAVGPERLWVRGVTYGTFEPDAEGHRFPAPDVVRADFQAMAGQGINAVRVYTLPPRWLLDLAGEAGLWVVVGLAWEQHIAFLNNRRRRRQVIKQIGAQVASVGGHPAILAFAVGNEIPASIVRWHGRRTVERFLDRLCRAVHRGDPEALVTYVNFPSSEYLAVPAADLVCFNVYLEEAEQLAGLRGPAAQRGRRAPAGAGRAWARQRP